LSDPLTTQRGWVYFIGAGPGDPGLMTMRGAEIVKQATIVFFDRLVGDEVFALVSPEAELVDVGKGPTAGGKSQRRTNELLIEAAKANHIVARLKGGDPFVFGRGGEEALDCVDAGIPFEIVPGVTSAIAGPAYAGIPVTHRGVSTNVCIVTGHGAEDAEPDVDWQSLGKGAGTLVVLMGVGRINRIVTRLIEAGRDPKTPVALVRNGTRPDQETLVSTLEEVAGEVARRKFGSPAAFIVGECVRLRDQLAWFETRPLFGRSVIVTRPAGEAEELNAKLRAAGAQVAHCPTIRVEPKRDDPAVARAIDALPEFDWLVLTSVNGVRCFFDALERAGKDARALAGLRVAVVGSKTGAALSDRGVRPDLAPETFTQEGVLEAMGDVAGQRILLARAALARNVLPDTLTLRGADVEIVTLYDTVADDAGIARLRERLAQGGTDWITFTSASTAQFLLADIPDAHRATLFAGVAMASIGPATSAALRDGGLPVDAQAKVSTSIGVYQAIVEHVAGE
jgi:uroporphyrinogen III methyltransferase/synthase